MIKILLSFIGVGLVVALFFLPRFVVSDEKGLGEEKIQTSNSTNPALADHQQVVTEEDKQKIKSLRHSYENVDKVEKRLIFADSLAALYVSSFQFDSAYKFYEEILSFDNQVLTSLRIGDQYLKMAKLSPASQAEKVVFFGKRAIDLFDIVLESESNWLHAKVQKAVALVHTKTAAHEPPLEGINMLKEIIQQYPKEVEARLSLGEFYLQRGQLQPTWLDKGIEQFQEVLTNEPDNLNALLFITESYTIKGDKEAAMPHFQRLQELTDPQDKFFQNFIERYEKELK